MKHHVLITGGASGIGKHLALGFAKHDYEVFVLDIIYADFNQKNFHFFKADLCNENEIVCCFQEIVNQFGFIDILINNGAISKFEKPIQQVELSEFDRVIHTNLRGVFLCCREFVRINQKTNFGRIINIASTRFHQNEAHWEAYGASKGGIVSLTNSLCVSLSNTNITVNAISPGWIEVEHYDSLSSSDHQQHPSGRVGKPSDIVNLCLFLCQPENNFINGANIPVDGGMTKRMIYE